MQWLTRVVMTWEAIEAIEFPRQHRLSFDIYSRDMIQCLLIDQGRDLFGVNLDLFRV